MGRIWIAFTLVFISAFVQADDIRMLVPYSRQAVPSLESGISDSDWRWLGKKQQITIATWDRENPPLDIVLDSGIYEGISSDYLRVVVGNLGLRCQVVRLASREAALQALASGKVDMVIDDPGTDEALSPDFITSAPYIQNRPALVSKASAEPVLNKGKVFSLAVAENFLSDDEIKAIYPSARIIRYADNAAALSAVAYQNIDAALGNLTSFSFLIDRNFNNALIINTILPETGTGGRYILRRQDTPLRASVDAVIAAFPDQLHDSIINTWFVGSDFGWLNRPVELTPQEQDWINDHPVVDVLAAPLFAPLTIQDKEGRFHGISDDVLRLISLRTGIHFRLRAVNDVRDMVSDIGSSSSVMLAAMTWSQERGQRLAMTRPYVFTSFVLVVADKPDAPTEIRPDMKIAVASGNVIAEDLKKRYPGITILNVANTALAMKLVEEGSADAAVHNQVGADYFIERYFPGKLKIAAALGERRAEISFAVSRQNRELEGILNKSLADIPPRALAKIVNKWQGIPDVELETWRNYSTWHYLALTLCAVIIVGTLAWAFMLRRAGRKRQKAQDALSEELAFRETLLNGSPAPVYVLDDSGRVTTHNEAWALFFSDVQPDALSLPLFDSRHPLSPVMGTLFPLLSDNESPPKEVHRLHCMISNGKEDRTVIHWAAPLPEIAGKKRALVCGWQDVTEHEALMNALSEEKARVELASKAKGTFLATMSHEIRTPVSAIIGLLELAETVRKADSPDGEAVRLAYTSAQSLLELIGEVLDLAKIESGSLELAPEWTDPVQIAAQTLDAFEGLARKKGLSLEMDNRLEAGYEYWLDAQRIRQILFNFVSNSVKFTHTGGVRIVLSDATDVEGRAMLNIEVCDTGIGISAEDQKKLFQPFSQLEQGKLQTGTGLGLVISAEFIKLMGGTFTLKSKPLEETRINLSLPAGRRRMRSLTQGTDTYLSTSTVSPNLHILVVDDHETNRLILRRQIERIGCRVTEAADGEDALLFIEDERFDLIITDCQMPGMDGVTMTQIIRQSNSGLMIWGLTANAQPAERERCLAAGMNECLFKPLLPADLEARLLEAFPVASDVLPTLPLLIDFNKLTDITGENEDQLQTLLKRAFDNNRDDYNQLIQAVEYDDEKSISALIHRMAGSADVLGATRLREELREIEALTKENISALSLKTATEQLAHTLDIMDVAYEAYFRKGR